MGELKQITVYTGTASDNISSANIKGFIGAAKKYNTENKWAWRMYTLGVNNDGKIRQEAFDKVKKELTEAKTPECQELVTEMMKMKPKEAKDIKRNVRATPEEKLAAQARVRKAIEGSGLDKATIDRLVKAAG